MRDRSLHEAIIRAEQGLVDTDLGGNVIKQRWRESGRADPAVIES